MSEPSRASSAGDVLPRAVSLRRDFLSGFLVFLIALPLCLAIAQASNFPPIAGIWTAVLGGLVATWISDSQLTIKGPAAGLIVIVAGAVMDLGSAFATDLPDAERMMVGYRLALGIGVASGMLQIVFSLLRVGKLGDFFPLAAVHGLLAAIGIIIISKQANVVLGVDTAQGMKPLELLAHLPENIRHANPAIALIGFVSLAIMFGLPLIRNKFVRRIPAPMVVLMVAIPLGVALNLDHRHTYLFPNSFFDAFGVDGEEEQMAHFSRFEVGPRFLVDMPEVLRDPGSAIAFPDFRGLFSLVGFKYLLLFSIIGSLESLLSAKAVDLLDPWRRKTNLDRDLFGIGVANTLAASIGGLPMISEIVRSSANRNNGAHSRFANFFHGMFLLAFALLVPNLIHFIPLAALAAMLVYTGSRLAHPHEFVKTWKVGKEQLAVFLTTIIITLVEDMLIGVLAGIAVEFFLHLLHGVSLRAAWRSNLEVEPRDDRAYWVRVHRAAVFTNWLPLRSRITALGPNVDVTLDFSEVHFVDHTVMEKLHELERDFEQTGCKLHVVGLDGHAKLSDHPQASRKKKSHASAPRIPIGS